MSEGKVANQQSLQVQNMKENLNEYKFVFAAVDSVLNTNDPVKSAVAHAGLYTSIYAVLLCCNPSFLTLTSVLLAIYLTVETFIPKFNEKVFASKPFTEEHEARFHAVCAKLVGSTNCLVQTLTCLQALKAESPYRFITFALPTLAAVGYIGKKVSLATIIWLVLICQCALMIPQVSEKVNEVKAKVNGMLQKKKQ